jgi:hypothetical protein
MSLVARMVVVMGMIIEGDGYTILGFFAMLIPTFPNAFNAVFAPSMHLVITSCLLKDIKSPLVS